MPNALVFVPIVAAQEAHAGHYLVAAGVFAALSACTSARCIFEELLNLPRDRQGVGNRRRPMAAGKTPLPSMIAVASVLPAGALALAFWFSATVGLGVLFYVVLGLFYLLWLRQNVRVGIITRALLNVFPAVVGAAVVRVPVSLGLAALWGS